MSPEQAELSPIDLDTRSDVYSLGALLYELLTGSTPVARERLVRASFDEVRCIIREEEPPRPSARVSTLAADAATTIAGRRRIDSRQLAQQLRGELDWIVLRAMEKDRRRRYESPGAFAADINRYLNNEAVQACPPSKLYGLKKLVSRHRGLFSATAAVVISLLIGLAFATYAFLRAEQESGRSRQIAQVLTEMLESADPSRGNGADYTVREMLDEIAGTLDGRFDDPIVESTLRHRIGRAYFHLGLPNVAEPHLRRALELRNGQSLSQLDEASILTDLAQTLMCTGGSQYNFAEPERAIRKAIEIYREEGDAKPELANSLCILGWVLYFKTTW
jgi:serine/threonine protein kinase